MGSEETLGACGVFVINQLVSPKLKLDERFDLKSTVTAEPVGLLDTDRLGLTDPSSISAADLIDPDASNRLSLLPEG